MKIKRNYNLLSKQINFFLIRIVLYLFTCLNTSYAMSDMNPTDPFVELLTKELKDKSISKFSNDSYYFVRTIMRASLAIEDNYIISNKHFKDSLGLFVLADVLYGLKFLPFRFTKNHIFRKITRSFAKVIFLAAILFADQSTIFNKRMAVITEVMNDMNNEFNDLNSDLNSDLKIFLLGTMPKLRDVVIECMITPVNHPTKLQSSIIQIQTGSLLLCAIGSLSFTTIYIEMFYSWVVTRITKLPSTPRNYAPFILFGDFIILLGCNIFATSLLLVRIQNVKGEIIFIDWLKNCRRVAAISILDDILNSPEAQDLLKSSKLNMERNGSDYNRMFQKVLNTMYTDYDSIRENGERKTNPFPSYYDVSIFDV